MENFRGHSLTEIGKGLNPQRIRHGAELGTQLSHFSDMPRQSGIGPEIPYRAPVVSDEEADDRGRLIAEKWFEDATQSSRRGNWEISAKATMWVAGSALFTSALVGLFELTR